MSEDTAFFCCNSMRRHVLDPVSPMSYTGRLRQFFIAPNETAPITLFAFCPWCGIRLPASLNEEWFDAVEKFGIVDIFQSIDELPAEFRTDAWWKSRDL
jgi:hypothetical protein